MGEAWPADSAPTQKQLTGKPEVKKAWQALKPKEITMSISEWIELRIGGELECFTAADDSSYTFIAPVGEAEGRAKFLAYQGKKETAGQKRKGEKGEGKRPRAKRART